jgi:hypothetical protein
MYALVATNHMQNLPNEEVKKRMSIDRLWKDLLVLSPVISEVLYVL